MYVYVCITYIYIYIHSTRPLRAPRLPEGANYAQSQYGDWPYCAPEIDTSEIVVDFTWHLPTVFQRRFPTDFHCTSLNYIPKG